MSGYFRVQVALQDRSLMAEDQYVSTFHLWHSAIGPPTLLQVGEAAACIEAFYFSLKGFLSNAVDGAHSTIKAYDMEQPKDTPPFYSHVMDLIASSDFPGNGKAPLPTELCTVLTLRHNPEGVFTVAKPLFGRVYIGPLNTTTGETPDGDHHSRPSLAWRQTLISAAGTLWTALSASGWTWVVHSRTRGLLAPVRVFRVDNSWDIQRRRGDKPTAATSGPATPDPDMALGGVAVPARPGGA